MTPLARAGVLLLAISGSGVAADGADATSVAALRTGDVAARSEAAARLRARDVRALGAALTSLGERGPTPADDLAFLVAFVAGETARPLRLLATEAAQRLGADAAVELLLDRAEAEEDGARAASCIEATGLLGTKRGVPRLLELLDHKADLAALAAADALARVGTKSDAVAVAERGAARKWQIAVDHCAWTVLDLVGDREKAANTFLALIGEPSDPRTKRVLAVSTLLDDAAVAPLRWAPVLAIARKVLTAAPREIPVRGLNPAMQTWLDASMKWLRTKAPADHWLVCASLTSIDYTSGATEFDEKTAKLALSADDCGLPPERFACLVFRYASIAWRKRLAEPSRGRRAWDGVILDSFELCALGGVDGAGQGGSREKFLERAIELRPWERR